MPIRLGRIAALLAVLVAAATPWSLGSGFHIYEQGSKASGQAVAFTARADDASAVYYNPAALAWLDGRQASFGASAVFIGDTTFDSQMDLTGSPLFTGGTFDMRSNTRYVPHAYYAKGAGDGRVAYGIGVFAPFGLVTEWGPEFDGRFSARESDLQSWIINPNVAYKLSDHWSVAVGVDKIEVELNNFSRNLPPSETMPVEALFDLQGDGDDIGWNAALSYKSETWAFGLSYRSGFEIDLNGEAIVSVPLVTPEAPAGAASTLASGPVQQLRQRAFGTLDLPETWAIGVAYLGVEHWELEFDMHKINWSTFEKLPINLSYGLEVAPGVLVQELVAEEDWTDTSSWRFGASRDIGERSQLRFGIYWEDKTIPQRTLRPSIPDSDRTGLSFGYGIQLGETMQIDAYWMHIQTASRSTTLANFAADSSVPAGDYESELDLIGVTLGFKL
jgi:long-chain fatty acid transport protein